MRYLKLALLLLATLGTLPHLKAHDAYNIRQISSRDGLSNSAVICLFQDQERCLWAGTYDGLNKYNGTSIQIYKPDIKDQYSISGNVIRRIVESKGDYLWIMTKGGLNMYSKKRDRVEAYFSEYPEDCVMTCDNQGGFFIMKQTGELFNYNFTEQVFIEIALPDFKPTKEWVSLIIDSNDKLWITNGGVMRQYAINRSDSSEPKLKYLGNLDHEPYIAYVFYNKGNLTIVDRLDDLYIIKSGKKIFIKNISSSIAEYGDITAIILDDGDIFIGFRTSGVIKLNKRDGYAITKIPINCGVFSLIKDEQQDILWVGTDGQGIYACVQDGYIFKGINLEELPLRTQRPVRAIFSDRLGDLWLGTKGNGIIKIKDYENATGYSSDNVEHLSVKNGLTNDAVFSFEMSRANNVLWIGSSGPGLNYYSFADKKLHTLRGTPPTSFVEVHAMLESSDSTLWVASQSSMLKLELRRSGNRLEAHNITRYEFEIKNKQPYNKIYSICQENDSIMWLAMRGNGAIRFNCSNGEYRLITFDQNGIAPMNDILSIHIDRDKEIWLGSSYGINNLKELDDGSFRHHNFNENDGLSNNTIHAIQESRNGELWFSSNAGIILFDPVKRTFRNFNQKSGLKVGEFSDNAYYMDERSSKHFFGGIDGVVWIEHGEKRENNFVPPIYFTKLRIQNEETSIDDLIVRKKGKDFLQLKHNQNFFTVAFSTNDFIDGANIKFAYVLENFNDVWINTDSREAQFTNIPAGEYLLKVKYGNASDLEGQMTSINIKISPPWYLTLWAKLLYVLAAVGVFYLVYVYITRRYERKRVSMAQKLDQKYQEEAYENKLRFFTNITHEFCTPLTLIHTPSERILNYEGSDEFVKKYAHVIKSNAKKLNNLIQDIIDFRRMEFGIDKAVIERCNINKICAEIVDAFSYLAEENSINLSLKIGRDDIVWNSDSKRITTILDNLVSNALKYTPTNGFVDIIVDVEDEKLTLKIYNSGSGIREEDIPYVFNRYSVMDNITENSINELSSRNGLGLAICKSTVELLRGEIEVRSQLGSYAEFIVKLPSLELMETENSETAESQTISAPFVGELNIPAVTSGVIKDRLDESAVNHSNGRSKILIVDDNEEMLWVLKSILSEEYNVYTAKDGIEGFKQLTNRVPDLVITDVMMPNQDGISMTKQIKLNPHTMHIPIVIISAKSAIDDKIKGIGSGAEAYIPKPFDMEYLKTVVYQLIEKHKKLRAYYNSTASSFDYVDGQLLSKEDRDFMRAAVDKIDQNIGNVEFTPENLAEDLSISLRSLYRRFKNMGLLSPKDFIKKQRIDYSAKLLVSTNLTIQEIMYSAGFTTRSHFYSEFTKHNNQSPKEYREQRAAELDNFKAND